MIQISFVIVSRRIYSFLTGSLSGFYLCSEVIMEDKYSSKSYVSFIEIEELRLNKKKTLTEKRAELINFKHLVLEDKRRMEKQIELYILWKYNEKNKYWLYRIRYNIRWCVKLIQKIDWYLSSIRAENKKRSQEKEERLHYAHMFVRVAKSLLSNEQILCIDEEITKRNINSCLSVAEDMWLTV